MTTTEADALWEGVEQTAALAYWAGNVWAGMLIVIVLAFIAAAVITAFVARRPGGYWMMSGVVAFAGGLILQWYFYRHSLVLINSGIHVTSLLRIAGSLPALLYSIGLLRLTWSLRPTHKAQAA